MRKKIFCIDCKGKVQARLTNGKEIYPHRDDLFNLPFWICDTCRNYVGCHHKSENNKTEPLGIIPNSKIRNLRFQVHNVLDPIWRKEIAPRKRVYSYISKKLGKEFHTGEMRTEAEAIKVIQILKDKFYPLV